MKFFVILEILLVLFRVSLPFLSTYSQFFEEWQEPMTWICVAVGAIAVLFIVARLCAAFRNKRGKEQ